MMPYSSLASLIASYGNDAQLDICIVTPDLEGPVRNGGIGTACATLACELAKADYRVQILFTPQGNDESRAGWMDNYAAMGISIAIIDINSANPPNYFPPNRHLATALYVYEWLAAHDYFDLVLFMDLYGNAFYSLCAKKCGLKFLRTAMAVIVHSPTLWHAINNISLSDDIRQAVTWHMERRSIEMADAVISPSAYMLDWCERHGYKIGRNAFVQPNLLHCPQKCRNEKKLGEAVFFGRLEYRKGIEEFCDALDILAIENRLPAKITFLGKCAWVGNEHALSYIARRMKKWEKANIGILVDKSHDEALQYLLEGGRFCVMPSVADNSPYTVYECLAMGIPFLARDTGGVKELIAREERGATLFGDNPHDLANKIAAIMESPPAGPSVAFDMQTNVRAWTDGLRALYKQIKSQSRKSAPTPNDIFISVCVTHHNRPDLLKQCLDSLLGQTYGNFEVILADDGSDDPNAIAFLDSLEEKFAERNWRILRLPHGYVGHARNRAALEASADWLIFLDDDNIAMPRMLETFARAGKYGRMDLIVSSFLVFGSMGLPENCDIAERFLPCGDIVSYSVIANAISDTTALINKNTFFQLGGFSEDYGVGHEDFELYLRFVLTRKNMGIIPDTLFWYRRNENKDSVQLMTRADVNYMRSMRPFMECLPADIAEMALMCHGMGRMLGCYPDTEGMRTRKSIMKPPERSSNLDPQSDEVLRQMFLYLEDMGCKELATQLIKSINPASAKAQKSLALMSGMYDAAKTGDVATLARNMKMFDESGECPRGKKKTIFYLSLLAQTTAEKAPYPCHGILIGKLNTCKISDIFTALSICGHSICTHDTGIILTYFFKALSIAEEEYKKERADVADAIQGGSFICALQHYALYGYKENMEWPHKKMFGGILASSPELFAQICNVHMLAYKYKNKNMADLMFNILK